MAEIKLTEKSEIVEKAKDVVRLENICEGLTEGKEVIVSGEGFSFRASDKARQVIKEVLLKELSQAKDAVYQVLYPTTQK